MKQLDPKIAMLEHSEAKVKLYGTYLSIYLSVLSKVPTVQEIYVFDLLCGEGIYQDGSKGSPLIALDAIRNHYFSNNGTCPDVTIWFNDNGLSQIEAGVFKVERVKRFCGEMFVPPNVEVEFFQEDYDHIHPKALEKVRSSRQTRSLFFIDPYGYKDVTPSDLEEILKGGDTEVLLFLPIAQMYRFAEKSLVSSFPGCEPLRGFLIELFGDEKPRFRSVYDFISQIRDRYRIYLSHLGVYVDTFTIERDASNVYSLFFFTSHIKGFEKMLEAKWKMDSSRGKGYTLEKSLSFLSEVEISGYPDRLKEYIRDASYRTNKEIYRFGLENGFLPKHTNEILRSWKKQHGFEIFTLDGKAVHGFYISYNSDRVVGFRFL